MTTLQIQAIFNLNSASHISGDRVAFGLDKALHLDPRDGKHPVIPASTIKGWLRHQVDAILKSAGKVTCGSVQPDQMCRKNLCLTCKYFGNSRHPSLLVFRDAVVEDYTIGYRMGVGLSRHRKTAVEDVLFSTETASGSNFTVVIKSILPANSEAREVTALIYLACRAGFALGSTRSRGMGWVENTNTGYEAMINGNKMPRDEVEKAVMEVWGKQC